MYCGDRRVLLQESCPAQVAPTAAGPSETAQGLSLLSVGVWEAILSPRVPVMGQAPGPGTTGGTPY